MSKNLSSVVPFVIMASVVLYVGFRFVDVWSQEIESTPTPTEETVVAAISPTSVPTHTPTEPPTPTNSATPTPTATPTATNSPVPPTNTPSPTLTDTPVPPTDTLAPPTDTPAPTAAATSTVTPSPILPPTEPTFDAVVTAANSIELYAGPQTGIVDYDKVATLRNGTFLNIQRRLVNNDDWIKVSAESGSEIIEGWVNIGSGNVEISANLDDFPPMYEFGPRLLSPIKFESRAVDGIIEFAWEGISSPLEEYQNYSLILVRDDLSDEEACYHWQTKETKVTFVPEEYGCTPGAYHWGVGIATDLTKGEGNERKWRDDSERDERNPIGLGIPHPEEPDDGGGDSGGGNNSGGGDSDEPGGGF